MNFVSRSYSFWNVDLNKSTFVICRKIYNDCSVVSNANFSSIERVRAPIFEYFRARASPSIRYSSIFEHEHHRALDIRTSSGTNISDSNQITQYGCNYVDFMEINILIFWRVFPRFEPRAGTSGQKMAFWNFERARTHTFPIGNERASSGSKLDTTLPLILHEYF